MEHHSHLQQEQIQHVIPRLRALKQELAKEGKDAAYRDRIVALSQQRSNLTDRPFHGKSGSFSVPRRTTPHSSQSSTSSATLSPSNSASQKGDASPALDRSIPVPRAPIDQLQGVELDEEKKRNLIDPPLPWRPFYLQRRILAAFVTMFAGLIITVEALWDYSNQNGLGGASPPGKYLWAYGPTAVFTLAAAVWYRVDFQAKTSAPWFRMSKGSAPAARTLLLDYISMPQPKALHKSLANEDWVVACTSAVTMLLNLMIIVSTALTTLSFVDMEGQTIPIRLRTEFAGNASSLTDGSTSAFFTMVGLQQSNLSYPDGVSARYAYQQFSADVPNVVDVGATVDGLSTSLDCSVAQMSLSGVQFYRRGQQYNTSYAAAGCNVTMPIFSRSFAADSSGISTPFFARFGQGGCGGSSKPEDQRIVVVIGQQSIDQNTLPTDAAADNVPINGTISKSAQLLCTPSYNISRVDVQMDAAGIADVSPSESSETRTLTAVQPWDIAQALFTSFENELASIVSDTTPDFYDPEVVNVDPGMFLALSMQDAAGQEPADPSSLLDAHALQELATDYFQQYSVLLASASLTQPASTSSTGTAVMGGEMLIIGAFAAQLLAALLATSIVLTGVAMLFVPRKGFLPVTRARS